MTTEGNIIALVMLSIVILAIWKLWSYKSLENRRILKRMTTEQIWRACRRENKLEHAEIPICFKCGFYAGRKIHKYDSNGLTRLSIVYVERLEETAKLAANWRFGDKIPIPEDWRPEGVTSIVETRYP